MSTLGFRFTLLLRGIPYQTRLLQHTYEYLVRPYIGIFYRRRTEQETKGARLTRTNTQ